jgi:hypothetical protein
MATPRKNRDLLKVHKEVMVIIRSDTHANCVSKAEGLLGSICRDYLYTPPECESGVWARYALTLLDLDLEFGFHSQTKADLKSIMKDVNNPLYY